MEIAFTNKSIRRLCENEAQGKIELGVKRAKALRRRLADLRAATCVRDLVVGNPREITTSGRQKIVVDLCNDTRLVFCPNHKTTPKLKVGGVDWSRVGRIKILKIERDHASSPV